MVANAVGVSLKINYAIGAILEHKVESTLRHYHTSPNYRGQLEPPVLVCTAYKLRALFETIDCIDIVE